MRCPLKLGTAVFVNSGCKFKAWCHWCTFSGTGRCRLGQIGAPKSKTSLGIPNKAAALKMLPLRFHSEPSLAAAEMVAALIKCNLYQARDKSATWLLNTPFFIGKWIHFSF